MYSAEAPLYFSLEMPFKYGDSQVIYVEDHYYPEVNRYIREHYDEICKLFKKSCREFIYFPIYASSSEMIDRIRYFHPGLSNETFNNKALSSDFVLNYWIPKYPLDRIESALIYLNPVYESEGNHVFGRLTLPYDDVDSILPCLQAFINADDPMEENVFYSAIGEDSPPMEYEMWDADSKFERETLRIMYEVSQRINELRLRGVDECIIQQLVKPERKLSRLVIDANYRIFLPDYNNMEIKMTPLPKAVFLLFLNHPEGLLFKQLRNLSIMRELQGYYKEVSSKMDIFAIIKSIDRVTDPLQNSINENCTRIREAFISQFDDELAKNYYITGSKGGEKSIKLPRELVEWKK